MVLNFKKSLSRLLLVSFFLLLICDLMIAQAVGWGPPDEIILDWDKLRAAVKRYDLKPNEDNARAILDLIPEKMPDKQVGDDERALEYMLDNSPMFTKQVRSGNEYLAEAAFRLYFIVLPGGALSDLELMLCKMLEKKPELYLRLLKKYKPQFPSDLEYPLFIFGPELVDAPDEQYRQVYRNRIKALETVTNTELEELKEECIKLLNKELERIR